MTDHQPSAGRGQARTFRRLADWVDGRLTRRDAMETEELVRTGDQTMRDTVAWIDGFVRFGRANPIPESPLLVGQRLRQAFERYHGRGTELVTSTAALSFDSRDDAVLAGVRGGFEVDEGYRLAFAAGSIGVLIDVVPDGPGTVQLDGQVLADEPAAPVWGAVIEHPAGRLSDIQGDGDGCFAVHGVPLDATRLRLSNGMTEIEVLQPLGQPGA